MYHPLSENKTKRYYKELLEETLSIASDNSKKHNTSMWHSIVNQIIDIKENVVQKQIFDDWEEIYDRYTLGTIAIQNFEENDEMQHRLCDIFGGAVHYKEFKE